MYSYGFDVHKDARGGLSMDIEEAVSKLKDYLELNKFRQRPPRVASGRRTGQPSTPPLRAIPDQSPTNESEHRLSCPQAHGLLFDGTALFSFILRGRRASDETGGPTEL
jgi:hypothetical protein